MSTAGRPDGDAEGSWELRVRWLYTRVLSQEWNEVQGNGGDTEAEAAAHQCRSDTTSLYPYRQLTRTTTFVSKLIGFQLSLPW